MKQFIILFSLVFTSSILFAQIDSLNTSKFTNHINSQIDSLDSKKEHKQQLLGVIVNFKTNEIIPNALVELYERDLLLGTIRADKEAKFSFEVVQNKRYNIKAFAENFAKNSTIVLSLQSQQDKVWNIKLFPIKEFIFRAPDKFIDIDNIMFIMDQVAFDTSDIKKLDKVVGIMEKYPSINISVNVHTDSNGMEEYDQKMTKDRADLIISYLINNGIDSERLGGIGFGSSMLLNHCTREVLCSEAEHRENRRTEFLVL